eukprot:scaffold77366_cov20-Tisochrysis_lutea.AAC.1
MPKKGCPTRVFEDCVMCLQARVALQIRPDCLAGLQTGMQTEMHDTCLRQEGPFTDGHQEHKHTSQRGPAETGIVRRIHFTYERATRKFKADLDLWLAWIDYCKSSNSTKQMSKVCLILTPICMRVDFCIFKQQHQVDVQSMLDRKYCLCVNIGAYVAFLQDAVRKMNT